MVQRQGSPRYYYRPILFAILALTMTLLGCDTEKTRNLIDERAGEAQQSLIAAREQQPNAKPYDPLVVTDKIWEGDAAMRMHRGMPLPVRYETARGITIISGQPLSLVEIADAITAQTGIPVRIADAGVRGRSTSGSLGGTSSGATSTSIPGSLSRPPENMAGTSNMSSNSAKAAESDGMLVSYEGPLSGLLERVAGYFGVNWKYDGTSVVIARFETRVFLIEALPNTVNTSDSSQGSSSSSSTGSTGSGSTGGGSSSGSSGSSNSTSTATGSTTGALTQSTNYASNIKYWEELKETLTDMLKGAGTVVVTPSNGEVVVTTTPEVMHTVSDYLAEENKRLSRQIAINIEIFDVELARDSDFDVDFGAAIGKIGNIVNVKAVTGAGAPPSAGQLTGLGTLSIAILNPDHNPNGKFSDTFSALSTVGDTTTVAQFPMMALNNRPVSRFVGTSIGYLQSSTGSPTTSTGTITAAGTTTLNPATINSGFTIQLTPRVLEDGRIMLQYSLSIVGTPSFQFLNGCTGTTTPSSDSTCPSIQLPTVNERSFMQQSVLRSGSMLVIGGVDEEGGAQNAAGVGDPFNWLLGGGTSNQTTRTMVFIAITPQVVDLPSEQGL